MGFVSQFQDTTLLIKSRYLRHTCILTWEKTLQKGEYTLFFEVTWENICCIWGKKDMRAVYVFDAASGVV